LLTGEARAQEGNGPRRLLILYSPNGCIHHRWRPGGGERDFVLREGSVLEPLQRWRERLLIVDGLNFYTGNNHEGGQAAMLTNRGGAGTPTRGMSLDQLVAERIGAADRFPSLEFGVLTDMWGAQGQTRISYRGPRDLVHPDWDPRRAFGRMFGDLVGDADAQARLRRLRRSILDTQRAELTDLHRRVGRAEQQKLQAHLASIRSVEQSLFSEVGGCAAPEAPDALAPDVNDNGPALLNAQIDLAVTALACGLTHVASIQFSHTVSPVVYTWAGNQDGHHSLSHADDNQEAKVQDFVDAERWMAGRYAHLLDRLEATEDPETGGGQVLSVGSQGYRDLEHLVDRLTGLRDACGEPVGPDRDPPEAPADCEEPPPGHRALRRLSHVEYAHTVHDILGVEYPAEDAFAADRVVHGFDNNADALTVTGLLADQYRLAAEEIAGQVDLNAALGCAPSRACMQTALGDLGARLLRRPLTAEEQERYLEIYGIAAEESREAGARWMIAALLQSPHFLYRSELGRRTDDGFVLTTYEIAAELSYLFWQTAPDQELRDRAADGRLLDPEEIATQATRLLADPRSAGVMERFADRWLELENLAVVPRDPAVYPELTPELRADMAEETRRFIGALWTEGGGLRELFTAQRRALSPQLAAHYGLPAAGDWGEVDLSGTPYGGILSHGSILTTHALPANSSPIHRGLMVRERLLCQKLPDPPANLDTSPPPVDPSLSTRERYSQHASDAACSGCHRLIDPIGFAFEHFDGIGRYRERDGMHVIDATGRIVQTEGADIPVDGLPELSAALAESDTVRDCYVQQWIRYGFGIDDALPMACYVNHIAGDGLARLSDVLPALAATSHFRLRIGEETEEDVPGADLVPTEPGEVVDPPPVMVEPEPEPEPGPVGAELMLREASRWNSGYCMDAVVVNTTDGDLEWAVETDVEGEINNLWNAERSADSGRVRFTGVRWNATIGAGQRAEFGWCARL
jgi:hypothetical protein